MSRYSKFNSSYILRKQHQTVDGGVIIERDWTTIGERYNIAPGKKRVSYDGNFLFTENTETMAYRKAATSRWVGSYNYNDVKDATDTVNKVKLNTTTDNPLVFAYYGSLYSQFEGSIINIIKYFPGNIVFGEIPFTPILEDYRFPDGISKTRNDFEINFISQPKNLTEYDNELRYMSVSWDKYVVVVDGEEKEIIGYSVENKQSNISAIESVYIGEAELFKYDGRYYKYDKSTGQYIDINIVESDNYFVKCNEYIKHKDEYYKWSDEETMYKKLPINKVCEPKIYHMYDVFFCTKSGEEDGACGEFYKISIYRLFDTVIYTNELQEHTIEIRPKKDVINGYFDGLTGIESIMLNRRRNPNYSFDMVMCETDEMGNTKLSERTMSWPKEQDGYCIRINGPEFDIFTDNILTSAENYDLHYSDNIWRSMTHEAIKNYDWSYERNSGDVDVTDNAVGSNVVCTILRLIGMEFDELKRYIEGITNSNKLTYDGFLNMPDSEVVNTLEMGGFDTVSTIWDQDEYVEIPQDEVPENVSVNNYFTLPSPEDILDDYISVGCEESEIGIHFYKRVSTLGDEVRLDYGFFNPDTTVDYQILKKDPWIKNNYSGYVYRKILFLPSYVTDDYWSERNTYDTIPHVGTRFSPRFARVYTPNGFEYYEKVDVFDNSEFMHSNWFDKLDPNYFSQSVVDIDLMRRLGLSSKNIFATKGTAHAIDMVMGVFGFGREDDDQLSDYEIIEPYHEFEPIPFGEDFWYYEPLQDAPSNVSYPPSATFAILPLHATENNAQYPVNIKVDDGFGGYYYFRKTSRKAADVAYDIYSSILRTSYDDGEYPGFPLATTYINGKRYFIPYMDSNYTYNGDIYFQMRGGWCKRSSLNSGKYDWTETVPYIKSVNTPVNLLDVSALFEVGDYVYVKYPLTNSESFMINPAHVSNYFKLVKNDVEDPSSWRNIPIDGPISFDNYIPPTDDDEFAPSHDDFINVKFIDEIIFTNIGNNPHKGGGKYDSGNDYLSYMRLPFKYSVDNANSDFSDNVKLAMAKQFAFRVSDYKYLYSKTFVHNMSYVYEEMQGIPSVDEDYWNSLNTFVGVPDMIYPSSPEYIRVSRNGNFFYFKKEKVYQNTDKQFLNSKVVIMKNLNNSTLYKRYFNSIILPYVLQVIPSTTIFVLENFNECETNEGRYYNIEATAGGNRCGTVTGSGRYFECDYAILTATPGDNCHFVRWELVGCDDNSPIQTNMDMSEPTTMIKVVGNACYSAVFEYNCTITVSNGMTRCHGGEPVYSDDVLYGRVYYNGSREFKPGTEYVIDDAIDGFNFTVEPIDGYVFDSWHVFNEGVDVTQSLIDENCITFSGDNLMIYDKTCICGCVISPVFEPETFTISAEIQCQCDDSDIYISEPIPCDPVEIWFHCYDKDVFCCDGAEFTYRVGNSGEVTKTHDTFDTKLIVERGSKVNIKYTNSSTCCKPKSIIVDSHDYGLTDISLNANNDKYDVYGVDNILDVSMAYNVVCCGEFFSVNGFYDMETGAYIKKNCPCGTDVMFECSLDYMCLRCNFIVNGTTVEKENIFYDSDGSRVYIVIENVVSDTVVEVGVDFDDIERPIISEAYNYSTGETIPSDCYEAYVVFPSCESENCNKISYEFNFLRECRCACKYEFAGWEILQNGVWTDFDFSAFERFDDYLALMENYNCSPIQLRPVVDNKAISLTVLANGRVPGDFTIDCTYGTQSYTMVVGGTYYFLPEDGEYMWLDFIFSGECAQMTTPRADGCYVSITNLIDEKRVLCTITEPCGDITLYVAFTSFDSYSVEVSVYDEETGNPTIFDCTELSDDKTVNKTHIVSVVGCGDDYLFKVKNTLPCCSAISRVVDFGTDITQTCLSGDTVTITGVHEDHNIRVYVTHPTYTVKIYYIPGANCTNKDCINDNVMDCLQVNCDGALSCDTSVAGVKTCTFGCDFDASFLFTKVCCNDVCCQYNYNIIQSGAFQYGPETEYAGSGTWNSMSNVITMDTLDGFSDTIAENSVLLVRYCCSPETGTRDYSNINVEPIEYISDGDYYQRFSEIPNCIEYTHNELKAHGKICVVDNELKAQSNDCWEFVGWVSGNATDGYELMSTDSEYNYCACTDETIYAAFEDVGEARHTVTCTPVILEQDLSPFNENMHTGDSGILSNYRIFNTITENGTCGKNITFTFTGPSKDYFAFQGLYERDSFTNKLIPVLDISVGVDNKNVYDFTVTTCKDVEYYVVFVPLDYITFYNPDFIEQSVPLTFEMGYYSQSGLISGDVRPDSPYLPEVKYWNGTVWEQLNFDTLVTSQHRYTFHATATDSVMVRIKTPEIGGYVIGNYVVLQNSSTVQAKIKITSNNTSGKFNIAGTVGSLIYGRHGYSPILLPNNSAKEIFKFSDYTGFNKPGNIFGYAFRNIIRVGNYALYDMFDSANNHCTSDFIFLENLISVGNYGMYSLFERFVFSGTSFESLERVMEHGFEKIFKGSDKIANDLYFEKLTEVGVDGFKEAFMNSDGQSSLFVEPSYPITVSFPMLAWVSSGAFYNVFFGCSKMELSVLISGSDVQPVNNPTNVFYQAFSESGIVSADIRSLRVPEQNNSGYLAGCFASCDNLSYLNVGCVFNFYQNLQVRPTHNWLLLSGNGSAVFNCSTTCSNTASTIGRGVDTVPQTGWTINTTICNPV